MLSRLDQPAKSAPAHTDIVHEKSFHSKFAFLKTSNTIVVLKIAHLLKAKNMGIFMCKMLNEPHEIVTKLVKAALKEYLALGKNCRSVGTVIPIRSSQLSDWGLSVLIRMRVEPKITFKTA